MNLLTKNTIKFSKFAYIKEMTTLKLFLNKFENFIVFLVSKFIVIYKFFHEIPKDTQTIRFIVPFPKICKYPDENESTPQSNNLSTPQTKVEINEDENNNNRKANPWNRMLSQPKFI